MFNSNQNCEQCQLYVTPVLLPMEVGTESIICVSDGASLDELIEENETW